MDGFLKFRLSTYSRNDPLFINPPESQYSISLDYHRFAVYHSHYINSLQQV